MPIRSGYLAATKLGCCKAKVSWERLCRDRRWGSSPFNSRQHNHHGRDNEQSDNNHPLNRSIVLIWIPTGHELDPIRKYWSDERQQTGYCGQANFNPEQTPKTPSHMKTSLAVSRAGSRWPACLALNNPLHRHRYRHRRNTDNLAGSNDACRNSSCESSQSSLPQSSLQQESQIVYANSSMTLTGVTGSSHSITNSLQRGHFSLARY